MKTIQKINTHTSRLARLALLLFVIGFATQSNAKDYKVEVLLFDNNNPSKVTERHAYIAPKAMRSGSDTWVLEPSLLNESAGAIQKSSKYRLRQHYSWGQKALPYQRSATFSLVETDTRGFIKVYADNLLFVNIDIDHDGFRMTEKRRLKLNERHFFDHPKFGILLQVSRLQPGENTASLERSR